MAFPYTTFNTFEDGTLGHFDVETDDDGRLDFPHYTELARQPRVGMPYRGAYCMRVQLAGFSATGAYVQETGSWLLTTGTDELYLRFKLFVSNDIVMNNGNEFVICQFASGAVTPHTVGTIECGLHLEYTMSGGYRLGLGVVSGTSWQGLALGKWHDVELYFNPAGGAGGTLDAWLDGGAFTQLSGMTNDNITSVAMGVIGQDSGTKNGTILFDQIIGHKNGARIGSGGRRFPEQLLLETSGHAFVGNGILHNVAMLSGNAINNIVRIYDTDTGNTTTAAKRLELRNLTANETPVDPAGMPIYLTKGCYVELSGTNPRAMLNIHRAVGYSSDGAIRNYAHKGR